MTTAVQPGARAREPMRVGLIAGLLPLLLLFILGVPLVLRVFVVEAFEIEGPSMAPALLSGDRVAVAKYAYGIFLPFQNAQAVGWGGPAPGDIVIMKSPSDGVDINKRVIGVGGDRIAFDGDRVLRNGQLLPHEPVQCPDSVKRFGDPRCVLETNAGRSYVVVHTHGAAAPAAVEVPEGAVYVMGDNRHYSNDSRNPAMGPVPLSKLKGRVMRIYYSEADGERAFTVPR